MNARKTRMLTALATSVALALPVTSSAAFDAFLKIDGIPGESTDDRHKNEIQLESWSFGATQSLSSASGGRGAGKSCLSDISLVKTVDKATPLLLRATMAGQHIASAVLTVRKGGSEQQDYLIITMKDILVSSVQQSGGGDVPMEALSLNFSSLKISYKPQKPDGTLDQAVEETVSGKC